MLDDDQKDLDAIRILAGSDVPTPPATHRASRAALLAAAAEERAAAPRATVPSVRRRGYREVRRRLVLVTAAMALLGVGVAAAYIELKPSKVSAGILCAEDVTRDPSGAVISNDGRSLFAQCAELWREGAVGTTGVVPAQLTACESGYGATYVFAAGQDACSRLGLHPAADVPSAGDREFIAFWREVTDRVDGCLSLEQTEAIVRDELRRHRLEGWTVHAGQRATDAQRCTSLAVDSEERLVRLVPIEQP